jgi:hypothetical protein
MMLCNVTAVGATRTGKSMSGLQRLVQSAPTEAAILLDPHMKSFAYGAVIHTPGEVLYERLSNITETLGFDFLSPSTHPNPVVRQQENQLRAEAFTEILLRRRNVDGIAGTPLMEEWCMAALMLFLFQSVPKPLALLPFAFLPGSREFRSLVRDCALREIRYKFRQLARRSLSAVRAEVGSAERLFTAVFRSPAFTVRSRGGFDLGEFLQRRGKLIIERGSEIGDDAMRTIMGAIVLLTIEHAKRRPKPYPPITIYIDEATNARLIGAPELHGIAETNKNGLYWQFFVQNLPAGADAILQNCHRHEWFACPSYDLARKAATDIAAGLRPGDASRSERIATLTDEVINLSPGWRWVRDAAGARKEYVPLLENPWPDWPGLREAKFEEKLQWIYRRPEYRKPDVSPCSNSSKTETPRPSKSPDDSSPATRLKRRARRQADGSPSSGDENAST